MKKIAFALVGVFLAFSAVLFSACGKDDNFFENTKKLSANFFKNEQIEFIFANDTALDFSTEIKDFINSQHPEYSALSTIYLQTLKNLTFMYTLYNSNLNLEPKHKTGEIKKLYKAFEQQMQELEDEAKQLLLARDTFNIAVGNSPNSNLALSQLNVLKTAYKKLIFKAVEFNESFQKLYTSAFLEYPNYNTSNVENGTQKLLTTINVGKLATANAKYIFDEQTGKELKNYSNSLLTATQQLIAITIAPEKEESLITPQILAKYLQSENAFNTELNQFFIALNNVNLTEYENSENKTNYLKINNNLNYYNKIQTFLQNSVNQHVINVKTYIG